MISKISFITKHPKIGDILCHFYNTFFGKNKNIKCVKYTLAKISKSIFSVSGKQNSIVFKNNTAINKCNIRISGNNNTVIVSEGSRLTGVSVNIEDDNNCLIIGKRFANGGSNISVNEGTTLSIGDDCLFAINTTIMTGDHHSIVDAKGNRINKSQNIKIGNRVWIGTGVIILKGTVIGDDSIVGAGSVVSYKSGENHIILAGNPTKQIKNNVSWLKEKI